MLDLCIILNGPPGCGKDTIAQLMSEFGFQHREMKSRLYADAIEEFDLKRTGDDVEFMERVKHPFYKEQEWDILGLDSSGNYFTPRKALIHTSEDVKKPQFGEDYYGKAAATDCLTDFVPKAVFSDGGFTPEVSCLQAVYETVIIIRLFRDGFDFSNDSRSYLNGHNNTLNIQLKEGKPNLAVQEILCLIPSKKNTISCTGR